MNQAPAKPGCKGMNYFKFTMPANIIIVILKPVARVLTESTKGQRNEWVNVNCVTAKAGSG